MNRQFPRLEVDAGRIRATHSRSRRVAVRAALPSAASSRASTGLPEIVRTYKEAGIAELGTSRIEQIVRCRKAGDRRAVSADPDSGALGAAGCGAPVRLLAAERARGCSERARARVRAGRKEQHSSHVRPSLRRAALRVLGTRGEVETCVQVERELPHVHLRASA